ncbi:MAG: hypothetical protein JXD23_05590 [Spirochaetales bacterium]|nr:hypothetical protein [Spirochaetales bacterium]
MKSTIFTALITFVCLAACGGDSASGRAAPRERPLPVSTEKTSGLSKADFLLLKRDMTPQEVDALLGRPARDIGSGFVIVEYDLTDGSIAVISFGGGKALLSARLIFPDGGSECLVCD